MFNSADVANMNRCVGCLLAIVGAAFVALLATSVTFFCLWLYS